jgi:type II secretory pathway pseudopilin PulG
MKNNNVSDCRAFTLIEIVVLLVLSGLVLSVTLSYFLSGTITSNKPVDRLAASAMLNSAMEAIVSDYDKSGKTQSELDEIVGKVSSFQDNYSDYCSSCSATSSKKSVGPLTTSVLITVTNNNEKLYHVFTVQAE